MKLVLKLVAAAVVFVLAGCAGQDVVDSDSPQPETVTDTMIEDNQTEDSRAEDTAAEDTAAEDTAAEDTAADAEVIVLDAEGIAGFETGAGAPVAASGSISLATGGADTGRLIPASSDPSVTLYLTRDGSVPSVYLTRDGSVPSVANNWGGPVNPANPPLITRQLEGTGTYRVVAEREGIYSEVVMVFVTWQHEESPSVVLPTFEVAGRSVSGSVELGVSDGSDEDLRLYIGSNYVAATLYISRDGSDPTPENYWQSQIADGTYLFSAEPTAASYRVIAVWQSVVSPVAALDVAWVE